MRLLVTGASGFLGRNLLLAMDPDWEVTAVYRNAEDFPRWAEAQLSGRSVSVVRCDLANDGEADSTLRALDAFDVVLSLAARVAIPESLTNPVRDLLDTAVATLTVARSVDCSHLIHLSTGAVYEGQHGRVDPTLPLQPSLPYAAHKLLAESYARAAVERFHTANHATLLRFFGAYGPYEPSGKIYSRLVHAFALERRTQFEIYGTGANLIDAMWVDDACDCLLRIVGDEDRPAGIDVLDLAAGHPLTIEELVRRSAHILGAGEPEIVRVGVANESNDFHSDSRDVQCRYGIAPSTPLEEGLPRLAAFLSTARPSGR